MQPCSSCRRAKCCVPFILCATRRRRALRLPLPPPLSAAKLRRLPRCRQPTRHCRRLRRQVCSYPRPTRIERHSHLAEPRAEVCRRVVISPLAAPCMRNTKHCRRCLRRRLHRRQQRQQRQRPKCFVRRGARTRSSRPSSSRCDKIYILHSINSLSQCIYMMSQCSVCLASHFEPISSCIRLRVSSTAACVS